MKLNIQTDDGRCFQVAGSDEAVAAIIGNDLTRNVPTANVTETPLEMPVLNFAHVEVQSAEGEEAPLEMAKMF